MVSLKMKGRKLVCTVDAIARAFERMVDLVERHFNPLPEWSFVITMENGLTLTCKGPVMQLVHDDKQIHFTVPALKDAKGRAVTFSSGPTWGPASSGFAVFTPDPVAADGSTGGTFNADAGTDNGQVDVQLTGTLSDGVAISTTYSVQVVSEDAPGFGAAVFDAETDPTPAPTTGGDTGGSTGGDTGAPQAA